MFKFFGIALLVLALVAAIVPNYTDCQSQGKMITLANGKTTSMKCHWAGKAELAAAIPLFVMGGVMLVSRRRETWRYLSIIGIALGGVMIALPTSIIGVCQTPTMICVTLMKPMLVSAGGLAAAVSLLALVLSHRSQKLL